MITERIGIEKGNQVVKISKNIKSQKHHATNWKILTGTSPLFRFGNVSTGVCGWGAGFRASVGTASSFRGSWKKETLQ